LHGTILQSDWKIHEFSRKNRSIGLFPIVTKSPNADAETEMLSLHWNQSSASVVYFVAKVAV